MQLLSNPYRFQQNYLLKIILIDQIEKLTFILIDQFYTMSQQDSQTNNGCSMVGMLGILIQLGLGVLSFSVLILKRYREKPRRPWKIWIFDTSKQIASQMIAHFINLTISIALAYQDSTSDQCLWYFMTNIFDNTVGVLVCILCLKGIQRSLKHRKKQGYISGNYYNKQTIKVQIEITNMQNGQIKDNIQLSQNLQQQINNRRQRRNQLVEEKDDSQIDKNSRVSTLQSNNGRKNIETVQKYSINYKFWLVQLLIWISIVVIGKLIIFGFEILLEEQLKTFSFFILGWIEAFPVLELVLVIAIVPVIMNGLAFWIQDNFLKKKQNKIAEGQNPLIEQATSRREDEL